MKKSIHQSLLKFENALFRTNLSKGNNSSPVFTKPIDHFEVFEPGSGPSFWGIIGPKKSAFLDVAASKNFSSPPLSRMYPLITNTDKQLQYLNFRESSGLDKVHLSARYESYSYKGVLEMSDDVNSVRNYITGANNYNFDDSHNNDYLVEEILGLFALSNLRDKWINSLSNGQMRRARIAKSLIREPKLLIIDDPFLGLDPSATKSVSKSLNLVANELHIAIIVGLRIQDQIPSWVTHIGYVDEAGLRVAGRKEEVLEEVMSHLSSTLKIHQENEQSHLTSLNRSVPYVESKDPIIEFDNASVIYKGLPILKNFSWKVERGSKWRILGDNGSGKTTLLSLITADHPQSWRSVISIDGQLRKTGSGANYFDINNKIGMSSPEIHALVPPRMRCEDIILNGLVRDVGNANFKILFGEHRDQMTTFATEVLDYFKEELKAIKNSPFNNLTVSQQKLTLFLRAIIKKPEILILDEAFSCMDDEAMMLKCHNYIKLKLSSSTILTIGHIDWEVPQTDYTLHLIGDPERNIRLYAAN